MFDELSDLDNMDVSDLNQSPSNQHNQSNGNNNSGYNNNSEYGNNNSGYNNNQSNYSGGNNKPSYGGGGGGYKGGGGGGYQSGGGGGYKGGGGGKQWNKKEDVVEDPYIPVAVYVDRDYPPEIKDQLFNLITKLINKGITVRVNGDDPEFHARIVTLPRKNIEVFIPWKGFNGIDSKHYFNMETSKHMASVNFAAWDKIPDVVKSMLARTVRMVFGGKNNSIVACVITWSPDGATKLTEVTKDTGKGSFVISLAAKYSFPVINIGKAGAEEVLARVYNL